MKNQMLTVMIIASGLQTLTVPARGSPYDYRIRYNTSDVYKKITDDRGNGQEKLYGTRNFRAVLHGVLYRGGANNAYHRLRKKNNINPLPSDGLKNLCQERFSYAVYTYPENFEKAALHTTCESFDGSYNTLDYLQIDPVKRSDGIYEILRLVHRVASRAGQLGPVYVHCWNGWHASGLVAALALRQFCDIDARTAVRYWRKTLDRSQDKYPHVVRKIESFEPYRDLILDRQTQRSICPAQIELQK